MTTQRPSGDKTTLLPSWLERWLVMALIGVVMTLADRRIKTLEAWMEVRQKADQAFELQYATDSLTRREWERQMMHDLRVLCGNKNLNTPCPEDLTIDSNSN